MRKTKDLTSEKFEVKLKKFWIVYTLLTFRILDVLLTIDNDIESGIKKLKYLSIERIRAKNYYK